MQVQHAKRLPNNWASNSKYVGQIELEVSGGGGTIAPVHGGLSEAAAVFFMFHTSR